MGSQQTNENDRPDYVPPREELLCPSCGAEMDYVPEVTRPGRVKCRMCKVQYRIRRGDKSGPLPEFQKSYPLEIDEREMVMRQWRRHMRSDLHRSARHVDSQ